MKKEVLLADDEATFRETLAKVLEEEGMAVTAVAKGTDAIDAITKRPYGVAVLDIQMPGVDGLEATRIIRDKGYNEIPIVAMTAEAMKGDREKCLKAGMSDYIPKPIKRETVYMIVKKWCLDKK